MAKKTTQKRPNSSEQTAVLQGLTQNSAAWMLGRTTSWLRDNGHRFTRDAKGLYDGRSLVQAVRQELEPAVLDDGDQERCMVAAETIADHCPAYLLALIGLIEDIEAKHSGAGLAAVCDIMRNVWKAQVAELGKDYFLPDTAEGIRAKADREIESLEENKNRSDLRISFVCDQCGKVRQGARWIEKGTPKGYAIVRTICPKCNR